MNADPLLDRCRDLVAEIGLADPGEVRRATPLTGGVASDIALVDLGARKVCVKFALGKLKVAEDWRAPVHRNRAEYAWLEFARSVSPENAPELHGRSEKLNGFAMEHVTGEDVYLWKSALLAEAPDRGEAGAVGRALGRLHAASTRPGFDRSAFVNRDDFHALRLEPYLVFTAGRHPAVAARLNALVADLYASDSALVHGDVSPKNILMRGGAPVLLDAECATMGDPSFDVAFCLNHLALKSLHLPGSRADLLRRADAFMDAYAGHVDWEPAAELDGRVAALLPALMLARVDGKSPVEYLDDAERSRVRATALRMIDAPRETTAQALDEIRAA
jgi:aminoglycoside phosphotransferase (APT) family kinase protein